MNVRAAGGLADGMKFAPAQFGLQVVDGFKMSVIFAQPGGQMRTGRLRDSVIYLDKRFAHHTQYFCIYEFQRRFSSRMTRSSKVLEQDAAMWQVVHFVASSGVDRCNLVLIQSGLGEDRATFLYAMGKCHFLLNRPAAK